MNIAWYALWFVVAVSLLVTIHEYGHFWVARRLGFKVLRFSVGFGKPLVEWRGRDGVVYAIAMLPLGGYVKLLDEREGPVPPADLSRSFTRKPPWQRILVLLAGPGFNFIFAILVLWGMFWREGTLEELKPVVGDVAVESVAARGGLRREDVILSVDGQAVRTDRDTRFALINSITANGRATLSVEGKDGSRRTVALEVGASEARRKLTEPEPNALYSGLGFRFWEPALPPVIAKVEEGGPAHKAGLAAEDRIVEVNGRRVEDFRDITAVTSSLKPGDELLIRYVRDGVEHTARATLGSQQGPNGREVGYLGIWRTGASYPESMIVRTELTPVSALSLAGKEAWDMTVLQVRLVARMVTGDVSFKNLSGPLSIAEFAGDSARSGVATFLQFLVLISLSLGFLNLLPIPILDGGQVVFQLAEWLKGSPLSERAQAFGQQIGIALLLLIMGVAIFNDIARQIGPHLGSQQQQEQTR